MTKLLALAVGSASLMVILNAAQLACLPEPETPQNERRVVQRQTLLAGWVSTGEGLLRCSSLSSSSADSLVRYLWSNSSHRVVSICLTPEGGYLE